MVGVPAGPPSATALPPLDVVRLRSLLAGPGGLIARPSGFWRDIQVVERTASTNQDLLARARDGAPEGLVLAAEAQLAGRGRQGRSWLSLSGAALTFSVLLRPDTVPSAVRGWLPLLAGVATATAVNLVTGIEVSLKWPNDVLIDDAKLAGILAEQADSAVVVGIGLNVRGWPDELPVPTATSLEQYGVLAAAAGRVDRAGPDRAGPDRAGPDRAGPDRAGPDRAGPDPSGFDRTGLLAEILRQLAIAYQDWCEAAGDPEVSGLRSAYLERCATIGREVKVMLPGGKLLTGTAVGVDGTGCLQVQPGPAGKVAVVSAGDVIHVR